jgi:fumarate hydratase class II
VAHRSSGDRRAGPHQAACAAEALPADVAGAIADAAADVAAGAWDEHFPIDVFQTGSGTSTNMNVNEVLAALAGERLGRPVHPNDEVNVGQSSNDVFPSAVHIAVLTLAFELLRPAVGTLEQSLSRASERFDGVVKSGRTHLMDATPVTLGQEMAGYAGQVASAGRRIGEAAARVGTLPLGGTATGTGLNAEPGFAAAVVARLAAETGLPLTEAPNHFEVHGARDALVDVSGLLRVLAVALTKIANDLRWMGSGPAAGLAEVHLPDLQPGSSIMPGKVNPVICETVTQVAAMVFGFDATVAFAGTQGAFELNVYVPVMAHALTSSIRLLSSACTLLATKVVDGLEADEARCRGYAERSPAIATALNPAIGYDKAGKVVKDAMASGRTIREEVVAQGLLSDEDAARILDVDAMARGGIRR